MRQLLRLTGSIWTFGYNSDGRLGTGDFKTKDIPSKTNILATYTKVKAGDNFLMALRSDGSIWTTGNNSDGQLGDGTTKSKNKLIQILGLSKIKKIAAGSNFGVAIDEYGIVYEWGRGSKKPHVITRPGSKVIDIAAGDQQIAFVTSKGKVFGNGSILNSELAGIDTAIRVEVIGNSLIILTSDGKVHEYKNGVLTDIPVPSYVIEISAYGQNVMYQTVDEKVYVSGANTYGELGTSVANSVVTPVLTDNNNTNVFGIGVGKKNTYIIDNTGNAYASRKQYIWFFRK